MIYIFCYSFSKQINNFFVLFNKMAIKLESNFNDAKKRYINLTLVFGRFHSLYGHVTFKYQMQDPY